MKTNIQILLLALVICSCSSNLRVYHDFDRDVSIQKLTDYDWLSVTQIEARNNPLFINELTDKRIKTAVDAQMKRKGYVLRETSAQIIVHYHIIVENKTSVRPESLGYNYSRYWFEHELDTFRYEEGTLIIDFMDARNCNLIWRGWAVSVLDDNTITEKQIDDAVGQIFKYFPVSSAMEVTLP